jgi:hypothetical protein
VNNAYRVFVVLDREYGSRLSSLAGNEPVWIVDTATNRAAAQEFWSSHPHRDHPDGVTTFKVSDDCSPENAFINELETIDIHHGVYSANPPYTIVEVIGTQISNEIRNKLSQFGFNQLEITQQGFRAVRPIPSDWSPDRWS